MKKILAILGTIILCFCFSACGETTETKDDKKLNIVCTAFPQYDFVREIAGESVNLSLLLKFGSDAHSFEPTPQDIININNADLFIMIGGVSEEWADKIVKNNTNKKIHVLRLIDYIDKSGDDEHIWTSPKNAIKMANEICNSLIEISPENKITYQENLRMFSEKAENLHREFSKVVKSGKRDSVIFADRFPFKYLANDIGLKYFSAFSGCSANTEPSASSVASLVDKIKTENFPAVFAVDYSEPKIANSIKNETGVKILKIYSCHMVSKEQFENGESYLSIMEKNLSALKEALN